ncbi:MAG TPA: LysM peptidoglycan-binding domain-containing protein [Bacillales bacterium]|nr:LysM peptidoglycan-binding domain-containing protein [Bacillales bacterium]
MQIEVVQRGETLWEIAHNYGVSVDSIVKANDMPHPNQLVIGQALVIPTQNRYYTVRRGDSLWAIARRFGTSIEAILRVNQIQNPAAVNPGMRLLIPHGIKPLIETNGYLRLPGQQEGQRVREVGKDLTYVSPFSYHVQSDGNLKPIDDSAVLNAARAERVLPLMVITNFTQEGFSSDLAHTILTNTDLQDTLISNFLQIMGQKGYRGLNIDFEYVYPQDRENYNRFLRKVVGRLHPQYSVSTAVAPKHSGTQQGTLYEAHDYPAHGRIVDFVILMTYEWGWAGGPAGAISPIPQMRRVLDYAVSVIPRDKIMMGVSIYGRDWPLPYVQGQTRAKTISEQQAIDRAFNNNVAIQYDGSAEAPHFQYTDQQGKRHEVWFEDARSLQAKYGLVKTYRLRGLSYWVLNYKHPQSWLLLEDDFRIIKR